MTRLKKSEIRENRLQQPSGVRIYGDYLSTKGGSISGSLVISGDTHLQTGAIVKTGEGFKVSDYSATEAYGWRDITGQPLTRGRASDPEVTLMGSIFLGYKFLTGKEIWITYHVPHDYVPNTPLYFHVHWTTDGTLTSTVKWQITATFAKGFNQQAFDLDGITATLAVQPSGIPWQHYVSETDAISLTGIEVDSLVLFNLKRLVDAETSNSNGVFVMEADIHYQSTNMTTKNKSPNFYT